MRRMSVIFLSTAMAVSLMGGLASASPPHEKTTGDVEWGHESIVFNAFDYGESGDRGAVTYTNHDQGFTYTAAVTAVHVDADNNAACFQYTIPAEGSQGREGIIVTFSVEDAGTPSTAPDEIGYSAPRENAPSLDEGCPDDIESGPTDSGNLVVHPAR